MRYIIKRRCHDNIERFYRNVLIKYRHTYSLQLMQRNVLDATNGMFKIENTLLRRKPMLSRWQSKGWHMAHSGKWYYAYTIEDDTITIQDAYHELNMHEEADDK